MEINKSPKESRFPGNAARFREWLSDVISNSPPETALPTDKELALEWGLSCTTVSREMVRFRNRKQITRVPGKGTFTGDTAPLPPQLKKARPTSAESLADALYQSICMGAFQGGRPLPSVKHLVLKYRVSDRTVSQAYGLLQRRGVLGKIGKSFWVGGLKQHDIAQPSGEVLFVVYRSRRFAYPFRDDVLFLSYRKMHRELWAHGLRLCFESSESLPMLLEKWKKRKLYPRGIVFYRLYEKQFPEIAPFFQALQKLPDACKPQVLLDSGGGKYIHPGGFPLIILSRGNLRTSLARSLARYVSAQGIRRAALIVGAKEALAIGGIDFDAYRKYYFEAKSMLSDCDFHIRVLTEGLEEADRERVREKIRNSQDGYYRYLKGKYQKSAQDANTASLAALTPSLKGFIREFKPELLAFTSDQTADSVLERLTGGLESVKNGLRMVSMEDNPDYYHLGVTRIIHDWDKLGFLMAHSVIGDLKVPKTSHGYIKSEPILIEKRRTTND